MAGLACACELVDAGLDVVVLEAKNYLGGRAHSFREKESGATIDNCQHVLLGCCSAAKKFLAKLGSSALVDFKDEVRIVDESGEALSVKASLLPAPLHLAPSIIGTRFISTRDKISLARVMAGIARRNPGKEQTALDYLQSLRCPRVLVERVIEPVLISALNEELHQASARYARMVLTKILMGSRNSCKLGVPKAPLMQVIEGPALRYLCKRGREVRTCARVERLNIEGDHIRSITLAGGEELAYDYYVCAVPPWSLTEMGFQTPAAEEMTWHPIISAHLFYEDGNLDFDQACVMGEPFQWVFNKSGGFGQKFNYVQTVASAADNLIGFSANEIIHLADKAVTKVAGRRKPALKRAVLYTARRATFSTTPGTDAIRPTSKTHLGNLFLAGDWTDTHWPATIESAVRSGHTAAKAVISIA
ncbi:MAG: hydroxysqualene dehydroxylase HpnE [Armatimonadota bacterium]